MMHTNVFLLAFPAMEKMLQRKTKGRFCKSLSVESQKTPCLDTWRSKQTHVYFLVTWNLPVLVKKYLLFGVKALTKPKQVLSRLSRSWRTMLPVVTSSVWPWHNSSQVCSQTYQSPANLPYLSRSGLWEKFKYSPFDTFRIFLSKWKGEVYQKMPLLSGPWDSSWHSGVCWHQFCP